MQAFNLICGVLMILMIFTADVCAQFRLGVGITYGADLYQYQRNPDVPGDTTASGQTLEYGLGSALFNLNIGPKFWMGVKDFSLAVEGQLGIAPFAFDVDQYKGLGAFYFPVAASLNYRGLSGFREEGGWGCGLSAGTQFVRTDLYFLKDDYEDIDRSVFQTYFGQINFGFGSKYTSVYAYARYGSGEENAQSWHIGFMLDFNLTARSRLKKMEASQNE